MNWDRISGKWTEHKGKIRERWAKLTDDDLNRIAGKRDQLLGVLQERYGWVREQAERQIKDFESMSGEMSDVKARPETDDEDEESFKSR
jgi:uncharacterized protein YjbJ (UPF0337 family)